MRFKSVAGTIFGIAMFALLLLGLYYLAAFGIGLFAAVSPEVTTVLLIGTVTVLMAASIIAGGLHGIGRREDARLQRAARAVVYDEFLRAAAGASWRVRVPGGAGVLPEDTQKLNRQMLLHGSPEVLKAYLQLQRVEEGTGEAGGSAPDGMVRLVRAMRRDLGHRSPDVGPAELGELMRVPERVRA